MIALRFGGGLTVPEIARATSVRRTTAEGRLYRALGKLRDQLEPAGAQPGSVATRPMEDARSRVIPTAS